MKRLLSLIALFPLLSFAQQQQWTLEQCMEYAVKNNVNVINTDIDYRNSKLAYNNSVLAHLPSLNSSISAGSNFGRGIDPETNTYINTTTFSNGINANLNIPIFQGLAISTERRNNKLSMLSKMEEQRKVRDKTALDCMFAYIEVVYNQNLVELTNEKVERSRLLLKQSKRMEELGTKNAADVAQIESELANDELTIITRENQLQLSIIKLKELMNFPADSTIEISTSLELTHVIDASKSIEDVYNSALLFLPQSAINKFDLQIYRNDITRAKWAFVPNFNASASIGTNYYTNLTLKSSAPIAYGEQLKNNIGESVGASLSIPLFNGLNKHHNLRRAKNNYEKAKNSFDNTNRQIRTEIETAMLECKNAEKRWEQAQKSVTANDLAFRANQRKYQEGLLNIIELQLSANNLLSAKIESVYSRLRFIILSRQVNYYKGIPYVVEE